MYRFAVILLLTAPLFGATPAERAIEHSRASIQKEPGRAEGYNQLAIALARRARETADPAFYDQAQEAIAKSLELAPENYEALKAKAWVLLGQHRFAEGLDLARTLNKKVPDDVLIYGFLTDAHIELGNYGEAEKAAQWMLDLRPGNIPGLTRGAYLRELFGDIDGAVDFMTQSLRRTRPEETEDRAWLLTHIGHLHLIRGRSDDAERALDAALKIFPDYHYALGNLAKVRMAQRNYPAAVALYQKRYSVAPHPENLYDVGAALAKAGRLAESKKTFAQFEADARKEMEGPDNSNRELIMYYLDFGNKPVEALRIAEKEAGLRKDVFTLDAYAWALYRNGKLAEAKKTIDQVLAVGVADSQMIYHAGAIAFRLKDSAGASKLLAKALSNNPSFSGAEDAKKLLARLPGNATMR